MRTSQYLCVDKHDVKKLLSDEVYANRMRAFACASKWVYIITAPPPKKGSIKLGTGNRMFNYRQCTCL